MRNAILDRVARWMILGALSTGVAGTLSAQTVLTGPADVKANAVETEADSWKLKAGNYQATDTAKVKNAPYSNILDGALAVGGGAGLTVEGTKTFEAGLAVQDDVALGYGGTLSATASVGGRGLFVQNGDFLVQGGTLKAAAQGYNHPQNECSAGIYLSGEDVDGGNFVQTSGKVTTSGQNGGDGIILQKGDYTLNGGELTASGTGKTFVSDFLGGDIVISGGSGGFTVFSRGTDYYGCGVVLKDGDFVQNGGTLNLTGEDGGCGIVIESGDFCQNGGELHLYAGDGNGLAAMTVDGNAEFGKKSTVLLHIDPDKGDVGTIFVAGNVAIEKGAKLDVGLDGSTVHLDKDAPITGTFLKMEKVYDDNQNSTATGTISGEFIAEGAETLTLLYRLDQSFDNKQYDVTLSRKAWASELLDGNNSRLAAAMEQVLPNLDVDRFGDLYTTYTYLDMATSTAEMEYIVRGLTSWQATQFARVSLQQVDATQQEMSDNIEQLRTSKTSACDPCEPAENCSTQDGGRHLWFSGLGNFAHYGAKTGSFSALDVDAFGMNVGVARKLSGWGRNAVGGFSFNYTNGNIDGGRSDTDFDYYGFLGTVKTDLKRFRGWAEGSVGYSWARFDQNRFDFAGFRHHSKVDQDVVRLGLNLGRDFVRRGGVRWTPIVGLEYTMIHQSGYTERGAFTPFNLNVAGDTVNSLRLRFGLEGAVKRRDLELSAYGFLRYETLDRYPILETRFAEAPMLRFNVKGQEIDRCSGSTGLRLRWYQDNRTCIYGGYDLGVGDKYTEHSVDVGLSRSW